MPTRIYPGRRHVGQDITSAAYPEGMPVYDGVDWYWGRSLRRALRFLDTQRPDVLILQWWSGAVLHTYLKLARYAARLGARVILEWHESQDVGEASLRLARAYVTLLMPRLLARVDAHIVHSEFDRQLVAASHRIGDAPMTVVPHGPYSHLVNPSIVGGVDHAGKPLELLYFGVVRPFKGVEDLINAFSRLDRAEACRYRLTVVGETWEGWTAPAEAIARSPHKDLIERIDRYVTDEELSFFFERADAVILPYHRSSASGPLHIAMSAGLPVVVTAVGGLIEAVEGYDGAVLVQPQDPAGLAAALRQLPPLRGQRFADPHSWAHTAQRYRAVIEELRAREPASPANRISDVKARRRDARIAKDAPYPVTAAAGYTANESARGPS